LNAIYSEYMKTIGLVFPHQLFADNPLILKVDSILLIEDSLFFGDKHTQLFFHKQKLMLHRASMRQYYDSLITQGIDIEYIEYDKNKTIVDVLREYGTEDIQFVMIDPTDFLLEKRIKKIIPTISILQTPLFINSKEDNESFCEGRKTFLMHHFYVWQRKRLNIGITDEGKPVGGKWSFDEENRKKLPQKEYAQVPDEPKAVDTQYVSEARNYVETKFKDNIGDTKRFIYPTSHVEAQAWFETFLDERFEKFGTYEDAITQEHGVLYHSLLSGLINIGLLCPLKVVEQARECAQKNSVPYNSVEGFIRQIIGWREYMRMMYERKGTEMRNSNYWNHSNALPGAFYTATTGIVPVDATISKVLATGYNHHIERLMILGSVMFMLEINPQLVYRWFMELYIDSYDWVMVPNVYAMSQNTIANTMTTKPYLCGSNYMIKMSDYPKGDWCTVVDALYWNFIITHRKTLKENHRMALITSRVDSFDAKKITTYENIVKDFRSSL